MVMVDTQHTVLCVDDDENILNSLKRLLRKENYKLRFASSGVEGLEILEKNAIHLIICDQRMPEMSGMEFLSIVKVKFPNTIRIVLTGYTEVDAITESINNGYVYKFFLKPWNDENLKLEINKALEHYDLMIANKKLHAQVLDQNEELKRINENLEELVKERTRELEIQNQALQLSQAILEDLPFPIIGMSSEGTIVLINQEVQSLSNNNGGVTIGEEFSNYFSINVVEKATQAIADNEAHTIEGCGMSDKKYNINITPLSGKFCGKGVIVSLKPIE